MTNGGDQEAPAPRCTEQHEGAGALAWDINGEDNIGEIFAFARKLMEDDWRFFDRLDDDAKTFTARKYDEVIRWFSDRWPEEITWPPEVVRPDRSALNEASTCS